MEMKNVAARLLLYFAMIVGALGVMLAAQGPAREKARQSSCAGNLKQLALAASTYAEDFDGRYPLKPRPGGDWMATQWGTFPITVYGRHSHHLSVLQAGPFFTYLKNACMNYCPSDPSHFRREFKDHPRSSYDWNYALAGKLLEQVKGQPLVWDREAWHRGRRNVADTKGMVRLVDGAVGPYALSAGL
jgi:hypothetical protein